MTIKKFGLMLVFMASMLVAISSGFTGSGWGWTNVPLSPSNTSPFGFMEPYNLSDWINFDYEPFNLSEYLFGPNQIVPEETDTFQWEPVPIIMPQPMDISKEELFKSKPIISIQKQSLISSLSSGGGKSILF